jgi:hypothetical protein
MELVQMATCKIRDGSCLGHLVGDLRLLLTFEWVISIAKITRKVNDASHQLARFGMLENRNQVWLGLVLEAILDRIARDHNDSFIN